MILLDRTYSDLKTFSDFMAEANSIGASFEQKTAKMVQEWLKASKLSKIFEAKRYQPLKEDDGMRNEDYSDVIVQNIHTGDTFFIECKEFERSNVLNMQFDINEDGSITPVKGKKRKSLDEAEMKCISGLTNAITESEDYIKFLDFLNSRNTLIKNLKPADFWFDIENSDADRFLPDLITKYNKLVHSGKTEADCKEFKQSNLRDKTKNILLCALCWRLSDPERTWDICKVDDIPAFGNMIRKHYSDGKAESVKYIQFGDSSLFRVSDDNPFKLKNIPEFPAQVNGEFTLKFTPRFGTGSIYVTPRSEVKSELISDYSFTDKDKWPELADK